MLLLLLFGQRGHSPAWALEETFFFHFLSSGTREAEAVMEGGHGGCTYSGRLAGVDVSV